MAGETLKIFIDQRIVLFRNEVERMEDTEKCSYVVGAEDFIDLGRRLAEMVSSYREVAVLRADNEHVFTIHSDEYSVHFYGTLPGVNSASVDWARSNLGIRTIVPVMLGDGKLALYRNGAETVTGCFKEDLPVAFTFLMEKGLLWSCKREEDQQVPAHITRDQVIPC